jgi:hypothetical protein
VAQLSLLSGTLTCHDVQDLEAHLRTDLDVQLKARGGFLAGYEYEDALTYFIGKGWELSLVYDSERGWSFSKLLRDRSRYWYVDYLRQRHGDSRYGQDVIAEELRDEDRPHVEWPEVLDTINIALLSPIAARAHDQIAVPHYVQGAPLVDISLVLRTPRKEVVQRLNVWKEEVSTKCLAA